MVGRIGRSTWWKRHARERELVGARFQSGDRISVLVQLGHDRGSAPHWQIEIGAPEQQEVKKGRRGGADRLEGRALSSDHERGLALAQRREVAIAGDLQHAGQLIDKAVGSARASRLPGRHLDSQLVAELRTSTWRMTRPLVARLAAFVKPGGQGHGALW